MVAAEKTQEVEGEDSAAQTPVGKTFKDVEMATRDTGTTGGSDIPTSSSSQGMSTRTSSDMGSSAHGRASGDERTIEAVVYTPIVE